MQNTRYYRVHSGLHMSIANKLCPRGDLPTYDTSRDFSTRSLTRALTAGEGVFSCPVATSKGSMTSSARGCVPFHSYSPAWVDPHSYALEMSTLPFRWTGLYTWICLER
jgi:hypothetical protein